jgi:uncharacterized protein YjeT (DUF2065 family)
VLTQTLTPFQINHPVDEPHNCTLVSSLLLCIPFEQTARQAEPWSVATVASPAADSLLLFRFHSYFVTSSAACLVLSLMQACPSLQHNLQTAILSATNILLRSASGTSLYLGLVIVNFET